MKTPKEITSTPRPSRKIAPPTEAKQTRKPREFTRTQGIIIDAVSDMLIAGGHPDSLDTLVMAAADHYARHTYGPLIDNAEKFEARIRDERASLEPDWRFDLQTAIKANKRAPEAERIEPEDVSGRIREVVRGRVTDGFNNFLQQANPEEMYLMVDILETWESIHLQPACNSDEVALGNAFQYAINRAGTFINVPDRMLKSVQRYVDALREVEGKVA